MSKIKTATSRSKFPLIIISILLLVITKYTPAWGALSQEGTITLAVVIIMALLWIIEPIPIYVTALLPLVIFPLFSVDAFSTVAANYANKNIYLFFGGFILAIAMENSGIHKRIALHILKAVGTKPANSIAGFILASGLLSMWISNTAATVLMMPVAFSVIALLKENFDAKLHKKISIAIFLSLAFSASIGGMGTLIGTPPNLILTAFAKEQNIDIGFGQFMGIGIPISLVGFFLLWFMFTKVFFRFENKPIEGTKELIEREIAKLSHMSKAEIRVLIVFIFTAFFWIFRTLLSKYIFAHIGITLSDPGIAMVSAITLFILSDGQGKPMVVWKDIKPLVWGIITLFGGGLALGQQIQKTGVGAWIAEGIQDNLTNTPLIAIIALITIITVIISQFASNTATTAAFLPIFFPLAQAINLHPLFILLPLTLGASSVFMLPSATPPNAIVMSGEGITIKDMVKYGSIFNIIYIVFIIAIVYVYLQFGWFFDTGDGTFSYYIQSISK